jgi:hypothetical protein
MARIWFVCVALLFLLAVGAGTLKGVFPQGSFRSFYCAGKTATKGDDPYRVEPLRTCEHAIAPVQFQHNEVEPAPLPGYALALFSALSALSPRAAALLFGIGLALATIAVSALLASLTGLSPTGILLCFVPLALLNVAYGELPPLPLLAIVGCGYGIATKKWIVAGTSAALSLLEPHVGVAVVLSTFLFVPKARAALMISVACLVAISIATLGIGKNIEYLVSALPSQAYSELVANDQFSLSHALSAAGVSPPYALRAGSLSYVAMLVIGIVLGRRVSDLQGAPEQIAFMPALAVLLGGLFMHDIEMIFALPAMLSLAAHSVERRAWLLWLAFAIVAVVWTQHLGRALTAVNLLPILAAAFAFGHGSFSQRAFRATAMAAIIFGALMLFDRMHSLPNVVATGAFEVPVTAIAGEDWGAYLRATPALSDGDWRTFLPKIPIWTGIILTITTAAATSRKIAYA